MIKRVTLFFGGFFLLYFVLALKPVQAEYVSVPAAAFRGITENTAYHVVTTPGFWYKGTPGHYVGKNQNPGKLISPVNFPVSYGNVTQMRASLYDSTDKGRILLKLIRVDLETGEWTEVYKVNSGKAKKSGGMIKTDFQGNNTGIDNSKYAWFLEADFSEAGQDLWLFSVRIEYM